MTDAPCSGMCLHGASVNAKLCPMARDDLAITFRPGAPYYDAIRAGIARTGLPDGHAITQILLAAFGETELLVALNRSHGAGAKAGLQSLVKRTASQSGSQAMKRRSR